jgi:hypothetical protein
MAPLAWSRSTTAKVLSTVLSLLFRIVDLFTDIRLRRILPGYGALSRLGHRRPTCPPVRRRIEEAR